MADIEGLKHFMTLDDRDEAPFFTGRSEILKEIERLAVKAYENRRTGGISSATRLISGAPGAGKTSILRRLEDMHAGGHEGVPKAVRCQISDLSRPTDPVLKLADAFRPGGSDEFRTPAWMSGAFLQQGSA